MKKSSLDLIQPSHTTGQKEHTFTPNGKYSKAAAELINRSKQFVNVVNSRSFRSFLQMVGPEHIAGDFTAYLDNQALAFTWPEFVSTMHEAAQVDPDYRVEVIDQSVDLDDAAGHAVVFMFVEVMGRPTTVRREDALVFEWKRQNEIWQCYGHTAIRGSSAVPLKSQG